MAFTAEQWEAVERRDRPLLLHAGAGSGKTAVLVERFVRAVREDGLPVDGVLAITFTEKAAGELRQRIRARFLEEHDREHARETERAWISTIHGFCSRVLRTHALAAGLDPDYVVLDEPRARRLALQAVDHALDEFLAGHPAPERLELLANRGYDALAEMIQTVHGDLRSRGEEHPRLPALPASAVGEERQELEQAVGEGLAELGALERVNATVERAIGRLGRCADALARLAPLAVGDVDLFQAVEVKRGNAKDLATPAIERYAAAQQAYLSVCRETRAREEYELLGILLDLFGARYEELKGARSALDFDDLELRARDLLRDDEAVRAHYRDAFKQVMVDEFQDTNGLQWAIVEQIAGDGLFTVGDPQQSIYSFRHADVEIFREHRREAEQRDQAGSLTVNFRTVPAVLDVLRPAYAGVFGAEFEGLEPPREEPGTGQQALELFPQAPAVELLIVGSGGWDEEGLGAEPFGASLGDGPPSRRAEARLLAHRLHELVDYGTCRAGEVAVLVRASTDIDLYEHALRDRGLPTYLVGGRGFWGQAQVADLRAYLSLLANPLDGLALHGVLASPLVGVSLDTQVLLAMHARRAPIWHLLERAFSRAGDGSEPELPGGERDRLVGFVERFRAERGAAERLSLERVIERVVTHSGYDRAVLAMPDGERRMANIRKLMRLARGYEAEEGRELRGFIDFLDEQDRLAVREGEAPLEVEQVEAIRLMTVHAAKGLEFPVVCVADLGRHARGDPSSLRISDDGRVGLSIASIGGGRHPGLDFEAIKEAESAAAEEEERRVFYVAMTRAERKLILSGATDVAKWPESKPLGVPMAWAWRAIAPDLPEAVARAPVGELRRRDAAAGRVAYRLLTPDTLDEVLPEEARRPLPPQASERPASAAPASDLRAVRGRPALPVGQLSYSSLQLYARCPYSFYLRQVLGLPDTSDGPANAADAQPAAAGGGLPGRVRGNVLHELLETLDFERPVVPSAERVAARLAAHAAAAGTGEVAEVRELIDGWVRSPLRERIGAARRVRTELPFTYGLQAGPGDERLLVNGVVDVHAEEQHGLLVVDYKSDRLLGRQPEEATAPVYSTQVLVYALAGLLGGAARVEVAHVFLERPREPAVALFAASDRPRVERELERLAAGVTGGRFEPTDAPHRELCGECPGRPALCSWGPEHTMRPRVEAVAA